MQEEKAWGGVGGSGRHTEGERDGNRHGARERERERERVKNAIFYETIWLLKYIIFNLITFSHFVYYNLGPKANVIDYELNLQRNRQDFDWAPFLKPPKLSFPFSHKYFKILSRCINYGSIKMKHFAKDNGNTQMQSIPKELFLIS